VSDRDADEVVIVGAGAAGLSVAAMLARHGVSALVLEREEEVGMSWARRYESLRLNTPRLLSYLPRYHMPRRYGRWPSRDQLVEYLRDYARRLELRVIPRTEVERVDRSDLGWRLRSSTGDFDTRCAVLATGHDHDPVIPDWPGREDFPGELLHSSSYREPSPFGNRDVLVVSARNSGSEIAFELARNGARRVRVAMRTPPNVVPREWLGIALMYTALPLDPLPDRIGDEATRTVQRLIYGDLTEHGLPRSPYGVQTDARRRHLSTLVDAGFVEALKSGELQIMPAVEAFNGSEVLLADGSRITPDAIICATGYSGGLRKLVGHLDVLDERGWPGLPRGGEHPATPGLYFNGYWASMIGQLVHIRRDARRIARSIARRLSA
jgi:putative flavoprotein involved in K+ transport